MSLDIQQVEQLNRRAQALNAERQQKLGMQQAARQAYEKAVAAYKAKYGVELDDTNLQQEYDEVHAQTERDFNRLNELIRAIENGEYTVQVTPSITQNTEPIKTEVSQSQVPGSQSQFSPQSQEQPQVQSQVQPQVQAQAPVFGESAQPTTSGQQQYHTVSSDVLNQASMGAMTQQVPTPPPITPPTPDTVAEPSEQAFTPQGWGTPSPDINQTFTNINNGKPLGF